MAAERNRVRWVPPPAVRRIAWCVVAAALAYDISAGWQIIHFATLIQRNSTYELTHAWPHAPFQIVALVAVFVCIPILTTRGPQAKKKYIPDPELSIRPR
jgi:hypothetical protein